MLVVGLTGGIATGKSTVSKLLRAKGLPIIDADVLARQVVEPGTPALSRIVQHFGKEILLEDGNLDRKKLGSIIFNDDEKRKLLNSIIHPAVRRALLWQVIRNWIKGEKICILDVPLLIEGPLWKLVAAVVVVFCPPEIQLARLMERDNSTSDEASSRISSQMPITAKASYADFLVDNSSNVEDLERKVDSLVRSLESRAGWTWVLSWLIPPVGILSAAWILTFRTIVRSRRTRSSSSPYISCLSHSRPP